MSRIIKEGVKATQRIEFVMGNRKYALDVERFGSVTITQNELENKRVELDMVCSAIDVKPCANPDFMEDVKALAKQYGYKLISIEVNETQSR